MSDGGRNRAPLGVEMWKSSQNWSAQRSAVRSIAWLGARVELDEAWRYDFGRWAMNNNMRLSAARTEKRVKAAFPKTADCETTCSSVLMYSSSRDTIARSRATSAIPSPFATISECDESADCNAGLVAKTAITTSAVTSTKAFNTINKKRRDLGIAGMRLTRTR